MERISITVNHHLYEVDVEPRWLLADVLREQLQLKGTHLGCEQGVCGACTVLINNLPARSCLTFAVSCDGFDIITVEGLADGERLHPVQTAFYEEHALQCGFCTPGFLMSAVHLLNENPHPTREEIRAGLSGNLCRCTGYQHIVNAVERAANITDQGGSHAISKNP